MSFLLRMTREASAEGTCQLIESSGTARELLDATTVAKVSPHGIHLYLIRETRFRSTVSPAVIRIM